MDNREQTMNPLYLFFSKRENMLSKIIARFQNGISHCGFYWFIPLVESPFILESKGHGGFNYSDDDEFFSNVEIVEQYQIMWTNEERQKFIDRTNKLLRQTYGFLGVVGMIFVLITRHLCGESHNPFVQGHFCSQSTYLVIREIFGFQMDGDPDERTIGPEDLRKFLRHLSQTQPSKVMRIK